MYSGSGISACVTTLALIVEAPLSSTRTGCCMSVVSRKRRARRVWRRRLSYVKVCTNLRLTGTHFHVLEPNLPRVIYLCVIHVTQYSCLCRSVGNCSRWISVRKVSQSKSRICQGLPVDTTTLSNPVLFGILALNRYVYSSNCKCSLCAIFSVLIRL